MKASELNWETNHGETFGYHEQTGCEISITGRIPQSMWTTGTNVRDWAVVDDDNHLIAHGHEDGLRNARCAALQALTNWATR